MAYSVGGRAHRILHRLLSGPANRTELAMVIQGPNQKLEGARTRVRSFAIQLRADGLITKSDGMMSITEAGLRAYDEMGPLEANVRIFVPRRAA